MTHVTFIYGLYEISYKPIRRKFLSLFFGVKGELMYKLEKGRCVVIDYICSKGFVKMQWSLGQSAKPNTACLLKML
jgi:hypothetical protein